MIDLLLNNLDISTVLFGLAGFIWALLKSKGKPRLESLVSKSFAASAIPTGIILVICSFKPELINKLVGINVYILAAGLVLIFVSYVTVTEK